LTGLADSYPRREAPMHGYLAELLPLLVLVSPSSAHPLYAAGLPLFALDIAHATPPRLLAPPSLAGGESPSAASLGKIAFESAGEGGTLQIHVMKADGSVGPPLTDQGSNSHPACSPDGKQIAFQSTRDGCYQIYAMKADGSGQIRLTNTGASNTCNPAWSPDGKKIAFSRVIDGNDTIWVMNADGSGQTMLSKDNTTNDTLPAWSPDGTKIAFVSMRPTTTFCIWVMNADGSGQTNLSNNNYQDMDPDWSPDGKKIAFQSRRDGKLQIYVMDASGSGQARLSNNSYNDACPAWSPDGKRIAFRSDRDLGWGPFELYLMNASGSNQTRLTHNSVYDGLPDWFPTYSVAGQAADSDGKPLKGVSLRLMPGDKWVYSRIDEGAGPVDGPYRFDGLPAGEYTVTAFKAGYTFSPSEQTITVGPNRTLPDFVGSPRGGDGTTTWGGLLVGVGNYGGRLGKLDYPVKDAGDLTYALVSGANWSGQGIVQLQEAGATRSQVRSALKTLASGADGDDVRVVGFWGHGLRLRDPERTEEGDGNAATLEAYDKPIYSDEFGHWLNQLGTSHYVVVLDCCFSGEHIDEPTPALGAGRARRGDASQWGFAGSLAHHLGLSGAADGAADLNDNRCGVVLAACREDQKAAERDRLRNGIFTHFVVEGTLERGADVDSDRWVSAEEAFVYAAPRANSERPVQDAQLYDAAPGEPQPLVGEIDLPDLRWRKAGRQTWVDDGKYRRTPGKDPNIKLTVEYGQTGVVEFSVQNDSAVTRDAVVGASPAGDEWLVRYYSALKGGSDVTGQVTSKAGWRLGSLAPGSTRQLRAEMQPKAAVWSLQDIEIATWVVGEKKKRDCMAVELHNPAAPTAASLQLSGVSAVETVTGAEVTFTASADASVTATVLNLAGRPVRTLCRDQECKAGANTLLWDGQSDLGLAVPNGTYLVEVAARSTDGTQARAIGRVRIER
jgi:Tol biopolymer transport system component